MSDQELIVSASAIVAKAIEALRTFVATCKTEPEAGRELRQRGEALNTELARRVKTGVRVNTHAGDFDSRRLRWFADQAAHAATSFTTLQREASTLASLLGDVTVLCARLADALGEAAERERAAAAERERERAEAEAAKSYLPRMRGR